MKTRTNVKAGARKGMATSPIVKNFLTIAGIDPGPGPAHG